MIEYVDATYSGGVTTVRVYYGKFQARGNAKLHPDDDFDSRIGYDLAFGRAMERLGAKLRKASIKKANNSMHDFLKTFDL
jgi:hypothetical protein